MSTFLGLSFVATAIAFVCLAEQTRLKIIREFEDEKAGKETSVSAQNLLGTLPISFFAFKGSYNVECRMRDSNLSGPSGEI